MYFPQTHAEISPVYVVETPGTANLIAAFSSIIIIVCAVSSTVFLIIGYACGWFVNKRKRSHTNKAMSDPAEKNACRSEETQLSQTPDPLYEELQPKSTPEYQDPVELNENVAYGPIAK